MEYNLYIYYIFIIVVVDDSSRQKQTKCMKRIAQDFLFKPVVMASYEMLGHDCFNYSKQIDTLLSHLTINRGKELQCILKV